jgi:NTP pyrophosphatase (non-canonical NTP hydrolase)
LTLTQERVGDKLMLIVTEIAEAKEGHRKNLKDDHLPERSMVEVELADAVIRIADLAGVMGLDLAGAVIDKLAYNANREDHKLENRKSANGKKT